MNYWLDSELFDLPECPLDVKNNLISEPADKFKDIWGEAANAQYKAGKLKFNSDSRVLFMFQCHRAGYAATNSERHPNYKTPRTYLAAQALTPSWDERSQSITWTRPTDSENTTFNLAAIRTLYRRCTGSVPDNMRLSEWIEARLECIEAILHSHLTPIEVEDDEAPEELINTQNLQKMIIDINRELTDQFWPDDESRAFMLEQCQPIDSIFKDDKLDAPYQSKFGRITFRWRFCFYPKGIESKQLGPFFVRDLEHALNNVSTYGLQGLSKPLQTYLLSQQNQIPISSPVNNGSFYKNLTNNILLGRWPDPSKYGLALLQSVAVNVASNIRANPIVAVNGPPGTGKTTLLKDVISDRVVQRTKALRDHPRNDGWVSKPETINNILSHSIVVASSNNKAVENISKELPALDKLADEFSEQCTHFRNVAPNGDWGLFCAVLGNAKNRGAFKPLLESLKKHLKASDDIFQLNGFMASLMKVEAEGAAKIILKYVTIWQEGGLLDLLIEDINSCPAATRHSAFFTPFTKSLNKVINSELTATQFSTNWEKIDAKSWPIVIESLLSFKRQWFGKKLFKPHKNRKLQVAIDNFDQSYARVSLAQECDQEWKLDSFHNLTHSGSYDLQVGEELNAAEHRLQTASPLGSEPLNKARSELFTHSLALNEAIIENSSADFKDIFDDIADLIDGKYQTHENGPMHQQLWATLFLFFPVISSSLSSIENQFKLMQKTAGIGLGIIDEAGQAVNYHVLGLLQRCQQAIFVGDPIQLEPVVTTQPTSDIEIASEFIPISSVDGEHEWGDDFLISSTSAQSVADNAGIYMSSIGKRKVGIPLLVHRRCTEPMFSIANRIAYDDKMILASPPYKWPAIQSGWIHAPENKVKTKGYENDTEAGIAIDLVQHLATTLQQMSKGGIYIITPFSSMSAQIKKQWRQKTKSPSNEHWMKQALGEDKSHQSVEVFADNNIGTVHTFQGKEASTVILCTSASKIREKTGGISWVNSFPNLLNVAVTRAKHHLFVVGNKDDWAHGNLSKELQHKGMLCYESLEAFKQCKPQLASEHITNNAMPLNTNKEEVTFDFG